MSDVFSDMIDITVIIYLDEILIYSDDMSNHKPNVQEVFRRLCTNRIFAQADKCKFHITSCEYLRYMLSHEGLTMALYKVQIIQDGLSPRRSKTFNLSSAFPTSTNISFMDTLKSLCHSHASPKRVPFGTLLMSSNQLR